MKNKSFYIEMFILIFMLITISLSILFSIYYISPNNYVLYDFSDTNIKTFTREIIILPNKCKTIKETKYPNKLLRIYKKDVNLIPVIVENKFKSENIYISKNNLIKLVNSDLVIKNTETTPMTIILELYVFTINV